ncbi:MAG TPA: serine/threonine-protein kinase, partial [Isosphaeraceae bacterium]
MSDATNGHHGADPTDQIVGPDQDPLDALAEEFAERCRRGEAPSMAEYLARHPDDIDRVRRLLGAVAMMEQLRRGSQRARAMPDRLGEFRILRELGRGGMGVVYEAVQESLDRHVAVKVIHHVHLDPKRLKRFQREAQAVAQLHHTNIVPIFGVGEHDGLPYYVMQIIHGHGLDALCDRWRREGSRKEAERWRFAAKVGVQAAEALHHAHDQGVLHRDVKPANLLVDEHEAVWITDFGLAKLNGREDLTGTGDVIGTLRYLAPEALHGETDARSDVYSLGLTLYELLTLEPPFGELSPSELLRQVSEGRPTTPRRLEPTIPADLETIILKATAREPEHRYADAGAMADDLRCFLEDRPIRARRATPFERAWRWSRRNRTLAALMATAASSLVLAAVVGWVGYARAEARRVEAEKATKRAEDNVALSLDVFGEL